MIGQPTYTLTADSTQLISDRNVLLASGTGPETYGPLPIRLEDSMAEIHALYTLWTRLNDQHLPQAQPMLRMVTELGMASHLSMTTYMLYHTVVMCNLEIREPLEPSSKNALLRDEAAAKISTCLEL